MATAIAPTARPFLRAPHAPDDDRSTSAPKSFLKYHLMAERTPTSDLSLYTHSLSWKLMADRPPIPPRGALARLRRSIEGLGPYQSLALLLVSISLGEPLKVIAVVFAGDGHWITATVMIIAAYAASLLVGESLQTARGSLAPGPRCYRSLAAIRGSRMDRRRDPAVAV